MSKRIRIASAKLKEIPPGLEAGGDAGNEGCTNVFVARRDAAWFGGDVDAGGERVTPPAGGAAETDELGGVDAPAAVEGAG
jgi:hypothetical protein